MKILAVSPHADDALLGCGGTLIKHIENGDDVDHCIVTVPHKPYWSDKYINDRQKQVELEKELIGYTTVEVLDFPTTKLNCISQIDLNSAITNVVRNIKPDIVYVPNESDLHMDHRLVCAGCKVALRPIHYKGKMLMYETPSETEWGNGFKPNCYSVITNHQIDKKIEFLNIVYKEEMHNKYPHPRSSEYIKILSKKRGYEIGEKYAEAFILVREIL